MSNDLTRVQENWTTQDQDLYEKLPIMLAIQQAVLMQKWQVWNTLFGSRKWLPNMGTTLRVITHESSPITRQQFFPNPITQSPLRDVHDTVERTDDSIIRRHNYESPTFNFLASFQDFRKNQVGANGKDLNMQVIHAQDVFMRTSVFHYIPTVYIPGKGTTNNSDAFDGDDVLGCPSGTGNTADTTGKTLAWRQALIPYVTSGLTIRAIDKAVHVLQEELQAPPFMGAQGQPSDGEFMKGKYCIIGSDEALRATRYDEFGLEFNRNVMDSKKHSGFVPITEKVLWKSERFPLRMASDGSFPAPQIRAAEGSLFNANETVPNPAYVSAPIEFAFALGGFCFESIAVGAPPSDFANPGAENKYHNLNWNGKVRMIRPVLINYAAAGATPVLQEDKYGEHLQLIADTVHGIAPQNRRHALLIPFLRRSVDVG